MERGVLCISERHATLSLGLGASRSGGCHKWYHSTTPRAPPPGGGWTRHQNPKVPPRESAAIWWAPGWAGWLAGGWLAGTRCSLCARGCRMTTRSRFRNISGCHPTRSTSLSCRFLHSNTHPPPHTQGVPCPCRRGQAAHNTHPQQHPKKRSQSWPRRRGFRSTRTLPLSPLPLPRTAPPPAHSATTLAMTWQPAPEGLAEVLGMLRDSSSPDSTVQKAVTKVRKRTREA